MKQDMPANETEPEHPPLTPTTPRAVPASNSSAGVPAGAADCLAIPDYELLRRISSVLNKLPHADIPLFNKAYNRDLEDSLAIVYLAVLSKTTASLNRLISDTSVTLDRKRGHMAPGFF